MRQATAPNTISMAPEDLERTFRDNAAAMLQAAHRVTGSAEDAQDVLQTVFLKLIARDAPITLHTDESSYLRRAAVNAALDLVRSRRKATVLPFDQAREEAGMDRAVGEGQHVAQELRAWLRSRLSQMSPMAAEAFSLRYFEGFNNQEVADMLGTSRGSVAVLLHRTRQRLQVELSVALGAEYE